MIRSEDSSLPLKHGDNVYPENVSEFNSCQENVRKNLVRRKLQNSRSGLYMCVGLVLPVLKILLIKSSYASLSLYI